MIKTSIENPPGLNQEVKDKIVEIMKPFKHGFDLESCLEESSPFTASYLIGSGLVKLNHYVKFNSNRGVCGDIALSCGLRLKKQFENTHVIHGATGNCMAFGSAQHCFLLMWPKDDHLSILQAFEHFDYSKENTKLPAGVTLLDPSEHTLFPNASDAKYNLSRQFPFSQNDFDPRLEFHFEGPKALNAQPLGSVEEIAPELSSFTNPKGKVCISFLLPKNALVPVLSFLLSDNDKVSQMPPDMVAAINPQSLLGRFRAKVEQQFQEQNILFPPLRLKSAAFGE